MQKHTKAESGGHLSAALCFENCDEDIKMSFCYQSF